MGVRADHQAGTPVDEVAEALLLARRLRVKIEDDCIGLLAERAGVEDRLCRLEGIVELGMHEDPPHDIGNQNAGAVSREEKIEPRPGVPAG